MWKYIVQPGRPQTKTGCERIACSIPKATNTHTHTQYTLLFHCNNGCTNELHCYIARVADLTPLFPILSGYTVVAQFRHPWNNNGFIYFTFAFKIGDCIWLPSVWDDNQLQEGRCMRRLVIDCSCPQKWQRQSDVDCLRRWHSVVLISSVMSAFSTFRHAYAETAVMCRYRGNKIS